MYPSAAPTTAMLLLVSLLFLLGPSPAYAQLENVSDDAVKFFQACAEGDLELVENLVSDHPEYAAMGTGDGETCLHLTAISASVPVTKFILSKGGDPNARVTSESGLKMHPLSWHVNGAHVEIVELLLDGGADVNAPFVHMHNMKRKETITSLDIVDWFITQAKVPPADDDPLRVLIRLLLERGAKKYAELVDPEKL